MKKEIANVWEYKVGNNAKIAKFVQCNFVKTPNGTMGRMNISVAFLVVVP